MLTATATSASAQSLGSTAAKYDLFVLNGPAPNKDSTFMDYNEGGFNGLMGLGQNSWVWTTDKLSFGGEVRRHTNLYDHKWNAKSQPGANVNPQGTHNSELNQANSEILSYYNSLTALSATQSYTKRTSSFTYSTTSNLTVLDFAGIDYSGSGDAFTLNGRAGFNDTVIIRGSADFLFDGGSPVILNNLDMRNVVWLMTNNSELNLHRNDGANFEGIVINPSDTGDYTTIIGDVDFKGQVFASEMKLGSGISFNGASIISPVPETSASMLCILGVTMLVVRRRR